MGDIHYGAKTDTESLHLKSDGILVYYTNRSYVNGANFLLEKRPYPSSPKTFLKERVTRVRVDTFREK
jgi:hypothetical protein